VAGEIPHACRQTEPPHNLRVCILRIHTLPAIYAALVRSASEVA
jgi:hypothetical protein